MYNFVGEKSSLVYKTPKEALQKVLYVRELKTGENTKLVL